MSSTIAALATGAQISAIGIVRVSGDSTIEYIDRLFSPADGRPMSAHENRTLVYGRLSSLEGELLDICLCTISRGPNSYTGEDTAEFQCHGSPVVLRAVLDELFRLGAVQAGPGEFTKRAFLNGRMELTAAEAVVDIIDAETIEAAKNAAGQLGGAIGDKISAIYSSLLDMASHFHAVLDYPDEDIEDFVLSSYSASLRQSRDGLERLLRSFERGKFMKEGIPTAIIGCPNAGKSSLLNCLLGYDRAIVTDIPGTTRDTIEEKFRLGSLCLRLTDTAGIRSTSDKVEQLGVERSRSAAENAVLVLAVIDGSVMTDSDVVDIIKIAEFASHAVIVLSKSDLEHNAVLPETSVPAVRVSSATGDGIGELEEIISEMFRGSPVPAGEILTNARQADAVKRALEYFDTAIEALDAGYTPDLVLTELEGAMSALGELNGKSIREDITGRIFARFCVGK